jgi:acetylornithine/succinyldiaminopimelate/putrescine aminotransferase
VSFAEALDGLGVSPRKREALLLNHTYLMPNRVELWTGAGVPLVIGRREGYRFWDVDGHELQDLHLNGGTYNLGHRNPELVAALVEALETLDVGNHHFPSEARGRLAQRLAQLTPGDLHYSVLTPSGSEANDVAIKSARRATGRRRIVSLEAGFHGTSGLSGAAGSAADAAYFLSDYPDEFVAVPFGDLGAVEKVLAGRDVAAVLVEPIPATFGFPIPADDYLPGLRALCDRHGTLLVADEVQTGLGRSGRLWAVEAFGVEPDMLVSGKGLGAGLYPIGVVVMSRRVGEWLHERGWGYVSTFGGAELGCAVALRALERCACEETARHVEDLSEHLAKGLADVRSRHPFLCDVRQKGLVVGLGFDRPNGGLEMSAALYPTGLWAMFAGYDRRYLQWKTGLLADRAYVDEALEKLETAVKRVAG